MAGQDYFTLFEPNESYVGAKQGDPPENHDHPQTELGLCALSKAQTHSGEIRRLRELDTSSLNHFNSHWGH